MPADLDFWHNRYTQQIGWTRETREYIFRQIGLEKSAPILEVGSGTGALLSSLYHSGYTQLTGLDIDFDALSYSSAGRPVCGDAHRLPFSSGAFTLAVCHFLLLWVRDPLAVLGEMRRVTLPGGWVIALAEPDYSARVDRPGELVPLGAAQTEALAAQGAQPGIGGRLGELFVQAGLENIESGVIAPQEPRAFNEEDFELEWAVLRRDLAGRVSDDQLRRWYRIDRQAALRGESIHYVPIHFVFGQTP